MTRFGLSADIALAESFNAFLKCEVLEGVAVFVDELSAYRAAFRWAVRYNTRRWRSAWASETEMMVLSVSRGVVGECPWWLRVRETGRRVTAERRAPPPRLCRHVALCRCGPGSVRQHDGTPRKAPRHHGATASALTALTRVPRSCSSKLPPWVPF